MNITRWILGITGGIAAYKTPELVRLLTKRGHEVKVVMSQGAKVFVTRMTLQAVSRNPVFSELLDTDFEAAMGHITLARWAQGIIIAPLSANRLAALAHGMADDLLTTLCLATNAPIWVAPAMNAMMWHHPATQANIRLIQERGVHILGPQWGEQACQEIGLGRMLEPAEIIDSLFMAGPLQGKSVLITTGPTREAIDSVRYLSNKSSGKMGFALAKVAKDLGANVSLIAGPVTLKTPIDVKRIDVVSAQEMYEAVMKEVSSCDIFISTAAVADFRAENYCHQKIKKSQNEVLNLRLVPNLDIVAEVARLPRRPFCVGFAAETENLEQYAIQKLHEKELDLIALNDVSRNDIGFESEQNALTVFSHSNKYAIARDSKYHVALKLLEIISEYYHAKNKIKNT